MSEDSGASTRPPIAVTRCYGTVIRRALLFAIPALIVPLALLTLWPVLKAIAANPRMLID